jgi:alpha-1,3-mannosyltransferase
MNILQLTRQFLPAQGGTEAVVKGLGVALRQRGHTVQVATLQRNFATGVVAPTRSVEAGLSVHRMRHLGSRRYPMAFSAIHAVRGYDLVHIHAIDFFVDYLSLLRTLHRVPMVVSTHGGYFHTPWARAWKQIYFQTMTRMSLAGVAAVVCVSQHDQNIFDRIVSHKRLRVIENGADLEPFRAINKCVDPGLLLGISRLAQNKRIHKVLETMASLKHRFPHLRLAWVGADYEGLRPSLERRVVELGLSGRVHFYGAVPPQELSRLLERAHLFVSASEYEGFGLSTIEAMSSATPVLVTSVGAHPNVVQHGVTGFLLDKDAEALTSTLARVLTLGQEQLQKMGDAARTATHQFSWTRIAPRYEELYREVIAAQQHAKRVSL